MKTQDLLEKAHETAGTLSALTTEKKNEALIAMAVALETATVAILEANRLDLCRAEGSVSPVMLDRLRLTEERVAAMAEGIRQVAALPDPVGQLLEETVHPNGMRICKLSVPIGVVAVIYESRPNVTSDVAALALKSGNVCVLRCGKEAWGTSAAVVAALQEALEQTGLPPTLVQLVEDTSRTSAMELMRANGLVDLLIPRGGAGLIRSCVENATVPCIQTGTGICHIYVDRAADLEQALAIVDNAKMNRPSVCNAAEVCLVHRDIAERFLPRLAERLTDPTREHPAVLRLDTRAQAVISGQAAEPTDFDTEFLDYVLAVKVVDDLEEAIGHIRAHSTHHSEAILTQDAAAAARFTAAVDSAAVYVNASTRFTDGGEFGLGCEIGISTQKLHARGPMGLRELTTYKYVILGNGQIRE